MLPRKKVFIMLDRLLLSVSEHLFKLVLPYVSKRGKIKRTTERNASEVELDQTGLVSDTAGVPKIHRSKRFHDVVFPLFDASLSHSFWRAQEVSLFRKYMDTSKKTLDFGCGDGVLSSTLANYFEYGVDIDDLALEKASQLNLFGSLKKFDEAQNAILDETVEQIISVSVLEHTTDLRNCIAFMYDKLTPDGIALVSVPTSKFHCHVTDIYGGAFEEHVRNYMYHRNIFCNDTWASLFLDHGFIIETAINFQNIKFTKTYFGLNLLSKRGIGRFDVIKKLYFYIVFERLAELVSQSINEYSDRERGNLFLILKKK